MPSLVLVMVIEFVLTGLLELWCCWRCGYAIRRRTGYRTEVGPKEYHYQMDTNDRSGRSGQCDHLCEEKYNVIRKIRTVRKSDGEVKMVRPRRNIGGERRKNDDSPRTCNLCHRLVSVQEEDGGRKIDVQEQEKRGIRQDSESDEDWKKRTKNNSRTGQKEDIVKILNFILQQVERQQALEYQLRLQSVAFQSLLIQSLWYQAFAYSLVNLHTSHTQHFGHIRMSNSHTSSDSEIEIERSLSAKEREALRTPSSRNNSDTSRQDKMSLGGDGPTFRYVIPFPTPGVPGAPYFNGSDVTKFLIRFQQLGKSHGVKDDELVDMITEYCEPSLQDTIRAQKGYTTKSWEQLSAQLKEEFYEYDTHQQMYSRNFLEAYKTQTRSEDDDIKAYCIRFKSIADEVIKQANIDSYTVCLWFLEGLPRKMRSKIMEAQKVKIRVASTMDFTRLYEDAVRRAETAKEDRSIEKKKRAGQEAVNEIIRRQDTPLKNDPTIVRTDGTLPSIPKSMLQEKEKTKEKTTKGTVTSNTKIDELASKLEALTLTMNTISETVKQQSRPTILQRPVDVPANAPTAPAAPNPRPNCYGCGKPGHGPARCQELDLLCQKGIIHRDENNRICWGKDGSGGAWVRLSMSQPWKDDIIKQAKMREQAAAARADVSLVGVVDAELDDAMNVNNVEICQLGLEDDGDTDEEFIDPDDCDELDILAAGMETRSKARNVANPMDKNKQVVQGRIDKEKRYPQPKMPRLGEYVDVPRRIVQPTQPILQVPESQSQTVAGDEVADSPKDVQMVDRQVKHVPVPRGKNLAKELNDQAKESSEKLLRLLMKQEVRGITVQDILGSSREVCKMMFQNLPRELQEEVKAGSHVGVSTGAILTDEETQREKLWAVATMKFRVNIGTGCVKALFDSGAEVNILLESIALALGLAIRPNVVVAMRGPGDQKSPFVGFVPDVPIRIGDVAVQQPFFILKYGTTACILGRPFETVTRLARQTLNDGSVRVTIFDPENDNTQATFQPYTPGDDGDRKGSEMVQANEVLTSLQPLN